MDNKFNIGEVIRFLRDRKRYTLRDLADQSKVSFSQLSKIERGDNQPTRETVIALARCLDFDKDSLLIMSGYAPDGMQQEFIERWREHQNRAIKADVESVSESSYNYDLNSRKFIYNYLDTTIQTQAFKSEIFNELMKKFNTVNEKERKEKIQEWMSFIDDMEQKGITPDLLTEVLEQQQEAAILIQDIRASVQAATDKLTRVVRDKSK